METLHIPLIDPALPLADLHRHLEGSLHLTTLLELGDAHGIDLPAWDIEGLRPHVQVVEPEPDLMSFLARFRWMTAVLVDLRACRRVAYECVESAHGEGLDYLELRFSPWFMAETHGLDPAAVTEAVVDGAASASRDTGLTTRLIGTLSRTYGPSKVSLELDALLTQREHLVAIDLAGDEGAFPGELFIDHFRRAREAGLGVTVHAGEAAGASSIWTAIHDLGATRIGHGVRANEDPALLDHMAEHKIGVEANLTSNVQTNTVSSYATHPLCSQLEHGILATVNTDDPTISGIDLRNEYESAAPAAGLSRDHLRKAQANALEIAFLGADEKKDLEQRKLLRGRSL